MRLSTFIVPVASILSLACAQVHLIRNALDEIKTKVDATKHAFNTHNGKSIKSSLNALDKSISEATVVVSNSNSLSTREAISLRSSFAGLQASIDNAFPVVKSVEPVLDSLDLSGAIKDSIVKQRLAVGTLGNFVVAKMPVFIRGAANGFVVTLDRSYLGVIEVYSERC
ncbi:hypothetical protein PgNI_05467 [Pyricularia grisea]|uniref:Cell wall galactomannoprotein n=1 Tax=Pyricularia grisea TaxID=148305 RepID=A0A6P8B593_PYRGI|nr:hypothetical protein PgNI_05467 [Pyricularia grisea]TLD10425.1 hypothetical protein PgNI_05467 [Pyricularia grisea]